ncbi:Unannotated [Lentimonas sp. CC19]|nr:Unannotated [Lentimonas sp. CC10]CAA6695628.1 Unannotated [Lentimonas sp. CC19]CAA7069953.1 Unannotated [Lentimonas sp. CC11]
MPIGHIVARLLPQPTCLVTAPLFQIFRHISGSYTASILLGSVLALPLSAQIYGIPDFAPFVLDQRVEREDYNLRVGPVMVDVVGTFEVEYNDNIGYSENNELSDFILKPGVLFGLKWQVNEDNELDLNLGAEYWHYVDHNKYNNVSNQVSLSPDTELSYRVLVGDMVFRVFDRLEYSFDTADAVVVDRNGNVDEGADPTSFARYQNTFGLQSEWFIGENVFAAQLSREDIWSPDDEYEYINSEVYKVALNVERDLAANFMVGVGTSYATFDYDKDVNNDGSEFSIGPYIDWNITEVIGLYAGLSWNHLDYDSGGEADNTRYGNDDQPSHFTWTTRLSHMVNDVFNHQLEWYRAITGGTTSNYNEIDGVRYTAAYNLTERVRLDGTVGYEENDSSGGLINDDFDRWVCGLSTELVLGPRLTAELGYRYTDKDSDAEFQSYDQNQFRLLLKYDF